MAQFLLCFLALWTLIVADDWTDNCRRCKCIWSNGRRKTDCSNQNMDRIPSDISRETREIDLSYNNLGALEYATLGVNVRDVHVLKFQNCSLVLVEKNAFNGLGLLIELDLSKNLISTLDKATFLGTTKIRTLILSHNRLKKLEQHLFYNLTHLQKISVDNNAIEEIDSDAFEMVPSLRTLNLDGNRLKVISSDFTENLPKISSLSLENNPWICDCNLQRFREKCIKNNLVTNSIYCAEPERVKGQHWSDASVIFACVPQILEPLPSTQIEPTSANVTLVCKVSGEPQPDVNWVNNGRIIARDPRQNTQRFFSAIQKIGDYTWNNLTITNVNYRDRGEYRCVAKNPGGSDEKNISLLVSSGGGLGGSGLPLGSALPLIIGLSVGAAVVLIIILMLVCCCCRRNTHGMNSKRRNLNQMASDECIGLHGQPEMEKALITEVNPVMKPPRICSVPPSLNSGGTEVSEVKRNLLDSDSVFGGDDESRSLDLEMHPYRKSQSLLDSDYRGGHHYPPDLLPYPARMYQISPAGSSASTVADTSRLPMHQPGAPQSPLHSPMYDTMSLYRTLPHSRSQSPFVGVQTRIPRMGYVTIPRRPRQSWSSEPPLTNELGEPLYDNLGLRTTVDGSSALSLNKLGEASTPKSARLFPLSPTGCDPIAEHEAPPARRNSLGEGKIKVAPVPPPKPKKRTSTGPLFEDEGEDGTEV